MYSTFEICFFIAYFALKTIRFIAIALLIQLVVYQLTGFSIYNFIIKMTDKIFFKELL